MSAPHTNYGAALPPGAEIVGPGSDIIVPNNKSRNWLLLTNIGENDVYGAFDNPAEVEKGILLGANGGSLILTGDAMSTGPFNGITESGNSKVIFQEGI